LQQQQQHIVVFARVFFTNRVKMVINSELNNIRSKNLNVEGLAVRCGGEAIRCGSNFSRLSCIFL
jgi:hypothetical protein